MASGIESGLVNVINEGDDPVLGLGIIHEK